MLDFAFGNNAGSGRLLAGSRQGNSRKVVFVLASHREAMSGRHLRDEALPFRPAVLSSNTCSRHFGNSQTTLYKTLSLTDIPYPLRTSYRRLSMPAMPRPRRTGSLSPSSEIRRSLWLEDEGLELDNRDRIEQANFSLPFIIRTHEIPVPGQARASTIFGVQLFHLDGRRDRNNTVAWWPYDIKFFATLAVSAHKPLTRRERLQQSRLYLNRVHGGWQGPADAGADEDFRICDADGPRLIKLEAHNPGASYSRHGCSPWDRKGKVLNVLEDPFEGVEAIELPDYTQRNVESPPPPQSSKTFAPPQSNDTPSGLPPPSLKCLLDTLTSIRTKARELLQMPGPGTVKANATLRNAFRDVLVTLAYAHQPPSKSTVDLVDVTALILEDSLLTIQNHHGILRHNTPLPYM
jgi:hypothetical protein